MPSSKQNFTNVQNIETEKLNHVNCDIIMTSAEQSDSKAAKDQTNVKSSDREEETKDQLRDPINDLQVPNFSQQTQNSEE